MSAPNSGYFSNAQSVREACAGTYKTEYALAAAIIAAIAVAIAGNETFTCTCSCSGYSQQDVQNCILSFRGSGFTTSYSGTTLTLSW
jgi:hypothetical protein